MKPVSKWMFWGGIALAVFGIFVQSILIGFLYPVVGQAIIVGPVMGVSGPLTLIAVELGIALIAFSFVARLLESPTSTGGAPPRPNSRQLVWTGVALSVIGLVFMLVVDPWLTGLAGHRSIWLDILHIVSPVLRAVCLPLGTMLIAASIVAKALETQRAADAAPAYQKEDQPPHAP